MASSAKKLLCFAVLLAAALALAVASASGAEPATHLTSTALKCEPTEGAVGAPRTCVATVTDIAAEPTAPTGQVVVSLTLRCSLVASGPTTATCSAQATPQVAGTYAVEVTYFGDVTHYSSIGKGTLVAGAAGGPAVPNTSLTWTAIGAPTTRLGKKPAKKTRQRTALFTFTTESAGAHFECRLDKNLYKPCTSPFHAKNIAIGGHVFRVRATSASGVYEEHPIAYHWKVLPPKH